MRTQPARPDEPHHDPQLDLARQAQRIIGPAELLQAIPYLLGFHPQSSLVLVGLDDGLLVVTARLDLADVGTAGVVHETLAAMSRGGSTAIVAVIYDERDDDAGFGDAADDRAAEDRAAGNRARVDGDLAAMRTRRPDLDGVADVIDDAVGCAGCLLLDVVWVAAGRWRSLDCADVSCCPPTGRSLPDAPSPFAAAATYAGMVALLDREALRQVLAPRSDEVRAEHELPLAEWDEAAMSAALDGEAARFERSAIRALFAASRTADKPGWAGVDAGDAARFGAALRSIAVRDAVWTAVDDGRLDGRALWRELGCRLPTPYDAPALFLFGWAVWRSGDGALAGIAADRALGSDPDYTAAELLLEALARGVDPRRLPRLGRSA